MDYDYYLDEFKKKYPNIKDVTWEFTLVLAFAITKRPLSASRLTELKRKMTREEREFLGLKWL